MNPKPINIELLDYDYNKNEYIMDGQPYTGIVFEYIGQEYSEINIVNGVFLGASRTWYISGVLKEEQHWWGNSMHGMYWEWYETGEIKSEQIFQFNVKIKEWNYDIEGNIIHFYEIDKKSALLQQVNIHLKSVMCLKKPQ